MKTIVVAVDTSKNKNFEYYVEELTNLVEACEFEVAHVLTQKLDRANSKYYIGSGKIDELRELVEEYEVDVVIIGNELSGSQNRNIEKAIKAKVIDRTQLILEIFARRAKSKEAKLQVSIAQLKYQRSRLVDSYEGMDRQGGGGFGAIARGSGETKLETDRRVIDRQINLYERELEKFVRTRTMQREKRVSNNIPVVVVVGYTNAGKSTLVNSLISDGKEVFEKDMLFATLDTAVRSVALDNGKEFLLIDTVGFVSDLPHELVKAFRSTLEEIKYADLIIHLCDASSPSYKEQFDIVESTLSSLDVENIEKIIVDNKVDLVKRVPTLNYKISAKNRTNLDGLLKLIKSRVYSDMKSVTIKVLHEDIKILSTIQKTHKVENFNQDEKFTTFEVELNRSDRDKYKKYIENELE